MKKVLLFSALFLLSTLMVFAYETIIIKFPDRENWVKAYYKKVGLEAILQYVPAGQGSNNWTKSVVVHSYNQSTFPISVFLTNSTAKLLKTKAQCEFFRVTRGYEGIVTIHYMNKNKEDFMENYNQWYNIIKRAKLYNSYYRDERMLDKAEYFEL